MHAHTSSGAQVTTAPFLMHSSFEDESQLKHRPEEEISASATTLLDFILQST